MDWIKALSGFSQSQISGACERYIRREPKRRPTPADVRELIHTERHGDESGLGRGDRSSLTYDEREILENKILPTARRWLSHPELKAHAEQNLAYWGERP